jgi:lysozyme family protein
MTNDDIIISILKFEGGFVNNPYDIGGATNHGITQETLSEWRKHPVGVAEVEALTEAEAVKIYLTLYVELPGFDKIWDDRLRRLIIDSGVQHGPKRVIKWLQALLKLTEDGKLGPRTTVAINAADPVPLFNRLLARRIRWYGSLISSVRSQAVFAHGWMQRAASFLDDGAPPSTGLRTGA